VVTGFQGDIKGGALSLRSCLPQSLDFGMGPSIMMVIPLTDNMPISDHHGSNHRIGGGVAIAFYCQFHG
jgi:hypothetical protein